MARRIRIVVLLAGLVAALLALLLPLAIGTSAVRGQLAERLGYHLESEISLERVEMAWLPVPHLLVTGVDLQRPGLELGLPEIHIFPSYTALLGWRFEPRRVKIIEPQLHFDPALLPATGLASPPRLLPRRFAGVLEIVNGRVEMAAGKLPGGIRLAAADFTDLFLTAGVSPSRLELELTTLPSFGRRLDLQGHYTAAGPFQLELKTRDTRLHELLVGPLHGVSPLEALANLQLTVDGNSPDDFRAELTGELPCFLVRPEEIAPQSGAVRLDCGMVELSLKRQAELWQLQIHDLEVKEPQLRLNGSISRDGRQTEDPHWEIDLRGQELNGDQIMPAVMALFGEFETTREVGEIVLGGRASKASFTLAGRQSELLMPRTAGELMRVEAEVSEAEIMVPEIDLHLPWAAGRLKIADSILELSQFQARLGNSHGRQGSLRTGLREDLTMLELDLELEADLTDLRRVLPGMVDHPRFQEELALFPRAEGRATGRLVVGDHRHDLTVDIIIEEGDGAIDYDRLPWSLNIHQGRLLIDREQVRWQNLAGTVGPHRLERSSGRIALNPEAPFVLEEASGELDSGALWRHLQEYPLLREAMLPVLSRVEGRLQLAAGRAEGELFAPQEWRYAATLSAAEAEAAEAAAANEGISWLSPLLATEVRISGGEGELRLSDQQVELHQLRAVVQDGTYRLDGRLAHRELHDWQGELELAGTLTADNRAWLQQRRWLPATFLPNAGLELAPLRLEWHQTPEKPFILAVNLQKPGDQVPGMVATPRLELTWTAHSPYRAELVARLADDDHRAQLQMELQQGHRGLATLLGRPAPADKQALAPVSGSFRGTLPAGALAPYFAFFDRQLQPGNWRGEMEFRLPPAPVANNQSPDPQSPNHNAAAPSLAGELVINDLRWAPDADQPWLLTVNHLDLAARNQNWQLHRLDLTLPQTVAAGYQHMSISGGITARPAGLELDLDLVAPFLSRSALNAWVEKLPGRPPGVFAPLPTGEKRPVTGRISFAVDEFEHGPWLAGTTLYWQPLRGVLEAPAGGGLVAEIEAAVLCCLEISGTWYSDPSLGTNSFSLVPVCEETPRFEKLLPCLGIEQDIITGECYPAMELRGDFDHWQSGRISIHSPAGGRILRLGLLARIFSLVNLTDIFTGGIAGLDEKGFAYQELEFEAVIEEHEMIIERAVIKGEGLNLIGRGRLNLADMQADMVVLVAPFKTLDTIVSWIPIVGRIIGGEDAAVITIPVAVKGDLRDPRLTVMSPETVGEGLVRLLRSTLMLPFNIISPLLPSPDREPDSD